MEFDFDAAEKEFEASERKKRYNQFKARKKPQKRTKPKPEGKDTPPGDDVFSAITKRVDALMENIDEVDVLVYGGLVASLTAKMTYMEWKFWRQYIGYAQGLNKIHSIMWKLTGSSWGADSKTIESNARKWAYRHTMEGIPTNLAFSIALVGCLRATKGSDVTQIGIVGLIIGILGADDKMWDLGKQIVDSIQDPVSWGVAIGAGLPARLVYEYGIKQGYWERPG